MFFMSNKSNVNITSFVFVIVSLLLFVIIELTLIPLVLASSTQIEMIGRVVHIGALVCSFAFVFMIMWELGLIK
jgi:hypothetical protein